MPLESVYLNACPPYSDYVINPRMLPPCTIYYAQHGTTAAVDAKRLNTIWQSVINSILMFAFVAQEKRQQGCGTLPLRTLPAIPLFANDENNNNNYYCQNEF